MSETTKKNNGSFIGKLIILGIKAVFYASWGLALYLGFMYYKYVKTTPIENVLVRGRCIEKETEQSILISGKQVYITEKVADGTYNGVIRNTGEEINCSPEVFEEVYGQFDRLPEALRPKHVIILDPLVELKTNDQQYLAYKSKDLVISGDCRIDDKLETLRHEIVTVTKVNKIKGKFEFESLRYKDSKKIFCMYDEISMAQAQTIQVEKAKLEGLTTKELVGRTVRISGVCTRDGRYSGEALSKLILVSEPSKVIEISERNGKPHRIRAGTKSNRAIVTCGGAELGAFGIEPYIEEDRNEQARGN